MATFTEQEEQIIEVICDKLGVDRDQVQRETTLRDDLDMDSLDELELCVEFERIFDINIDDEDVEAVKTVGDYITLLANMGIK
jgi:acyl carrier protein